jgi:hypothetical protein
MKGPQKWPLRLTIFQRVSSDIIMKQNISKCNETERIDPPQQQLKPRGLGLPERQALQSREAAAYCGVSVLTLKRLAYRGLLHPNRATGRLLFLIQELDQFLRDPRSCPATTSMKVAKMK